MSNQTKSYSARDDYLEARIAAALIWLRRRCRLAVMVLGLRTPQLATAKFFSPDDAVIRVFDVAGNVIEIHKYTGNFKDREWI